MCNVQCPVLQCLSSVMKLGVVEIQWDMCSDLQCKYPTRLLCFFLKIYIKFSNGFQLPFGG